MELFEELKWRGLVDNVTSEEVEDVINNGEVTFYIGTDPTADSLHIGHYSSLLMAKRLEKHGHHPIMLVGGATGFIGDPKATGERSMLTPEVLKSNYDALHAQISKLWGFDMVNNLDWTKDITIIDFLRDYGKLFNVNYMLNKETVKKRLDSGISYTEFSYMILQSLDFLNLYQTKGCTMQIGGQDQWGNITSGLELIRKKCGADVKCYGLTMPLITKADGTKFGKSETGTVWLDPKKTSPYELYQFLFNTDDSKVIEYLKKLTFLTKEEIDEAYEKNTGVLIADEFAIQDLDYIATPAVLCKNHGPFTWGKDAHEAVHNAVVLEEVAKMAARCEMINPDVKPAPQELQDKHYYRKHGANAYYGQNTAK